LKRNWVFWPDLAENPSERLKLKNEYTKLTIFKIYGYDCKNDKRLEMIN